MGHDGQPQGPLRRHPGRPLPLRILHSTGCKKMTGTPPCWVSVTFLPRQADGARRATSRAPSPPPRPPLAPTHPPQHWLQKDDWHSSLLGIRHIFAETSRWGTTGNLKGPFAATQAAPCPYASSTALVAKR